MVCTRNKCLTMLLLAVVVACDNAEVGAPEEDRLLELVTDTLFVVGDSPANEEEHFFGRISAIGFDREGLLHVLDPDQYEVTT